MSASHALTRRGLIRIGIALGCALTFGGALAGDGARTLFVTSAIELPGDVVSLPLQRGVTAAGDTVWFTYLDTSDGKDAVRLGVNHAAKLNNARGTAAVMKVSVRPDGTIEFPASVNFAGTRSVKPGPTGFPPSEALAGPKGDDIAIYSPLIQLPDGTIRNAPHLANRTGVHPKVVSLDQGARRVRLQETRGFAGGKLVRYVSTDASVELAAALENATLAPTLNAAPFAGGDGTDSARATIVPFVNGQTGADNPQRQGLNSAIVDGLDPLNVTAWTPNQGRYSPLWDLIPAQWSPGAIAAGLNQRQTDVGTIRNLAQKGLVTGIGGSVFGPIGGIVNCPIISLE